MRPSNHAASGPVRPSRWGLSAVQLDEEALRWSRDNIGADDGIRTRDPTLARSLRRILMTYGDAAIWPASWESSFACDWVSSRHHAVAHGTPTGPLCR